MAKRVITKAGDLISIPLGDGRSAVAIVTFVFSHFKNCIAVGIYPELVREPVPPSEVPAQFAIYPVFTGKQLVTAGHWPRIGHLVLPAPLSEPPEMIVAGGLYRGDQFVRPATPDEVASLPQLLAYGSVALQNLIRKHFLNATNVA